MLRKDDILAHPQGAGRAEGRARRDRRHRPSRQPPRALGRRIDGKSVSRRPAAHGARDPRAHELGRDRHRDAARSDQRQAGGGGGARVLRLVAALAVHGSDQSAFGDHAQAPAFGAWAGRPDARTRGLRGARRASDPLRPHLPDRDAGRPEYRPHQQPRDLCARQSIRLHREPVSPRRRRQGDRRGRLSLGDGRRPLHDRPGQCRARCARTSSRPTSPIAARAGDFVMARPQDIDFIDVSPKQIVSVAAALIPVPRERRRQPRADGLEHATSGRAAHPRRGAARRHRHGRDGGARFRRDHHRPPRRASSIRSTPRASSSARPRIPRPTRRASISTIC